jgi:Tol biopolymer transport system component
VLDIAPDGTQFVYASGNVLYLRPIAQLDSFAIPIQNVPRLTNPTFSADGKSIVFWAGEDSTMKRIPITGGAAVTLCAAENPHGMAWEEMDRIVFGQGTKGIFQVSASGGKPDVLVAPQKGETLHGPHILPGGKAILFTSSEGSQWDGAKIFVQPLPSGNRKLLVDGGTDARYLPTGHLIYFLAGNLLVVPFDPEKLEVMGRAIPVIEGVRFSNGNVTGTAQFNVSSTGTLIYWPSPPEAQSTSPSTTVTLLDSAGTATAVPLPVNPYVAVRVSPDGKQLAVATDDGRNADIWVYDLSGKTTLRRLTLSGRNLYPVWSSDSKHVLFQSDREKDLAVFWQLADGTGQAERLTKPEAGASHIPESWLPGQQKFSYWDGKTQDIWIHSLDDGKDIPFVVVPDSNQYSSAFSPDGRWVTYRSMEAGKAGIYVEPYPQTGARYLVGVNENGAWSPVWSPDSKTVYFHRAAAGQIHGFVLQQQPFQLLNTVDLPVTQFRHQQGYRMYDVLPDGKRFVVIRSGQQGITAATAAATIPPEVKVVLNWFEELKKIAPPQAK